LSITQDLQEDAGIIGTLLHISLVSTEKISRNIIYGTHDVESHQRKIMRIVLPDAKPLEELNLRPSPKKSLKKSSVILS
jgi:hypothetical protein